MSARTDLPGIDDLPRRWGRYDLQSVLGQGGWGRVFCADLVGPAGFRKPVALKMLLDPGGAAAREMLFEEARLGARLHHPNVVDVYDVGEHDGVLYVAMELVDGCSARALLDGQGPLPAAAVVKIGQALCAGLDHAHGLREGALIHQDIKPDNVLLDASGRVRIADFGIARSLDTARRQGMEGTVGYCAPEQLGDTPVGPTADLFSVGVTLAELALGRPVFPSAGAARYAFALVDPAATLAAGGVPEALRAVLPGLDEVLLRCMAGEPRDRWPDARSLAAALDGLAAPTGTGTATLARRVMVATSSDPGPSGVAPYASARTAAVFAHNLPPEPDVFVGRAAQLEQVEAQLAGGARVITLKGPGGAGKTRLARRIGRRLVGDGCEVWFCDLAEAEDVPAVVAVVASVLGVGSAGGASAIAAALQRRGEAVLILDNAEQAVGAIADVVVRWREASAARFVVTSREALRVAGEVVVAVDRMSAEDAVALFEARGGGSSDPDVVLALVERLDRLPLAVELAAASMLGPRALLERLEGSPGALRSRRRDRPARHGSVDAVLTWSWDLLEPWERSALLQLSVFRGGFTIEAAEAVLDLSAHREAPWTMFVVEALLERSLVWTDGRPGDAPRFSLYLLVRDWAADRLEASGDGAGVRRRLVDWAARMGTPAWLDGLHGARAKEHGDVLRAERANLSAALDEAVAARDLDAATALACAVAASLTGSGPFDPPIERLGALLRSGDMPWTPEQRLRIGIARQRLLVRTDRLDDLEADVGWTAPLATNLGDAESLAYCRSHLATVHMRRGSFGDALRLLDEGVEIARAAGARRIEGKLLANVGVLHHFEGRVDRFLATTEAAMGIHREVGDIQGQAIAVANLAAGHALQGDLERARELFEEAEATHGLLGDERARLLARLNLGLILAPPGAPPDRMRRQEQILAEVGAALGRLGSHGLELLAEGYRWVAALRLGRADAEAKLRSVVASMNEIAGHKAQRTMLIRDYGAALLEIGRPADALARLEEAAREAGDSDRLVVAETTALIGLAHADLGDLAAARSARIRAEDQIFMAGAGPGSIAAIRLEALVDALT